MSIRSISSTTPGLGFGQPNPSGSGARRPFTPDPSALSVLSWGDRELVAAMFGADLLTTGRDEAGETIGLPAFVWLVIEDRRNGRLPGGSEITSSYLETVRDGHPELLTDRRLAAALTFISRRHHGATVDIRA